MEVIDWKNYEKKTGRLTWRVATPDDLPAIRRLRNVTERFLNTQQRNPGLFESPVLLALVALNERGTIVDLIYAEAQVEIVKMACTAVGFEESLQLEEDLRRWLRSRGFRKALVTTSHRLKEKMRSGLEAAGFKCVDRLLSYWSRSL